MSIPPIRTTTTKSILTATAPAPVSDFNLDSSTLPTFTFPFAFPIQMDGEIDTLENPLKVAVVGGGVSGLTAAWTLSQYPKRFEVTLYEKRNFLGGHCKTMKVSPLKEFHANPQIGEAPVDSGFILCNPKTYPNFFQLLNTLNIHLTPALTSFSLSRNSGQFEWASHHIGTLFAQTESWFNFSSDGIWRMLFDMARFYHIAKEIVKYTDTLKHFDLEDERGPHDASTPINRATLNDSGTISTSTSIPASSPDYRSRLFYEKYSKMNLKTFLDEGNYSYAFRNYYLIPQTASMWSSEPGNSIDQFPVLTLIRFLKNHDMLRFFGKSTWLTIPFGASTYIEKMVPAISKIRLSTAVKKIYRGKMGDTFERGQVEVVDDKKERIKYDYVILAAHSDQVLPMLVDPTKEETAAFHETRYMHNRIVLHRDPRFMPRIRSTWASWNYIAVDDVKDKICLTYWMNKLQPYLSTHTHGDIFLTLNPLMEPRPETIIKDGEFRHPKFDLNMYHLQKRLPSLQHVRYCAYAGAWTHYGFHEDGVTSGLRAAAYLGASPPFHVHGGLRGARVPALPLLPTPAIFIARFQPAPAWSFMTYLSNKVHTWFYPNPKFWIKLGKEQHGMSPVPVVSPAYYLYHPTLRVYFIYAIESLETLGFWVLLFLSLPILIYLYVVQQIDIEDGLDKSPRKELLWVHPRLRIVWRNTIQTNEIQDKQNESISVENKILT